jgi:tetraacyldisaccharide 4'-kinase
VPIIVVGNLTVGGAGKTPLVIALAQQFKARGLRVGIVSRGFGATLAKLPYEVNSLDEASLVGDEPLLLAKKAGCPVVIAPKRPEAVQYLIDHHQSEIIISDDGLQHYRMGRAIEIVVIDGLRGLGNGFCLPAGPLREGVKRLQQVDFIVSNGGVWPNAYRMDLLPGKVQQLSGGRFLDPETIKHTVAAVAAIGHPQRFFMTLRNLGVLIKEYSFPDHHLFEAKDFLVSEQIIVMTEKDAVKCKHLATEAMYFLPVNAVVSDQFWNALWSHQRLKGII